MRLLQQRLARHAHTCLTLLPCCCRSLQRSSLGAGASASQSPSLAGGSPTSTIQAGGASSGGLLFGDGCGSGDFKLFGEVDIGFVEQHSYEQQELEEAAAAAAAPAATAAELLAGAAAGTAAAAAPAAEAAGNQHRGAAGSSAATAERPSSVQAAEPDMHAFGSQFDGINSAEIG